MNAGIQEEARGAFGGFGRRLDAATEAKGAALGSGLRRGERQDEEESTRVGDGVASVEADREIAAFEEGGQFGLEGAGAFTGGGIEFPVDALEDDDARAGRGEGGSGGVVREFLEDPFKVSTGLTGDGVPGEIHPDPGQAGVGGDRAGHVGLAASTRPQEPQVRRADEGFVVRGAKDLMPMQPHELDEGVMGGLLGREGAGGQLWGMQVQQPALLGGRGLTG